MRSGATPSSRALFEEAQLVCGRYRPVNLLAALEEFVHDHRPHGTLTGDVTEPAWNGYLLTVACPCGVVFTGGRRHKTLLWTYCLLTSVRVGIEGETAFGAPGSRSPDCCHRSVCPCSSFGLSSLAQLPVGHRKLRVRRHRPLLGLSRQPVLFGRYATTGAGATSRA